MTTQPELAAPGRRPPAGCLSYEEFLDWCDGETRAEWVDGVVEVVLRESIARDRGVKFVEYEQAGIPEYWLIDPEREQAEFYELGDDGRYKLALGGRDGRYRSRVLEGFTLDLDWLWQNPLPRSVDLLRQLGVLRD